MSTIPEGTLSLHGNDLTVAFSNRQDAEVAMEAIERSMSTKDKPEVVTDEMVRKALDAYHGGNAVFDKIDMGQMRAALEAALPSGVRVTAALEILRLMDGEIATLSTKLDPVAKHNLQYFAAELRKTLSAIESSQTPQPAPAPQKQCTTEGCEDSGTRYFESGGVGSYYCRDCYRIITARLSSPTPATGCEWCSYTGYQADGETPCPCTNSQPQPRAPNGEDEAHEIGFNEGYEKAVQDIDVLTGGDGEYRCCTDGDPERHTPDAATMKQRIADRFTAQRAERERLETSLGICDHARIMEHMRANTAEARVAELAKALEPFANSAPHYDRESEDMFASGASIRVKHLRAARAALKGADQ